MRNIVLIRTSTVKQEVETQKREVIEYASSYGAENIVVIGGAGASAIKLDDQYLFNLQQVYAELEKGDVQCIYAWSIDRIGRNEEVLMQFKNHLIKHKVQLRIKNPTLYLFDEDGKVNSGMEIAFSLFSTMAKQEMEVKQERFRRSKARNRIEGKYNGGRILFGYTVDETNHFIVDEVEGRKVYDIFYRYATQPVSIRYLAKEYIANGTFTISQRNVETFINRMLKKEHYKGNATYPRIIDDELFLNVQAKLKNYRILPKVRYTETPYYLQGIIYDRDPECWTKFRHMRVKKSERSYMSYGERYSLSINNIDSLAIQVLNDLVLRFDYGSVENYKAERIEALNGRKNSLLGQVGELERKDTELDERYFGGTTIRNYDSLKQTLNQKINTLKDELVKLDVQLDTLEKEKYEPLNLYAMDDNGRREVCIRYISHVYCTKMDERLSNIEFNTHFGNVGVVYNRMKKVFTYTSSDEPHWQPIKIIRFIDGRKRSAV